MRLGAHFPTYGTNQNCQPTAHQAYSAGLWNSGLGSAIGDDVVIQRHCTISRQGTSATDACAGIQRDAGKRENISRERGGCTKRRGAADLPIYVRSQTIGKNNSRAACSGERATYLKDEQRIGITQVVQRQCPSQLSGTIKMIDAGGENHSAQVLSRQVDSGRHACRHVVGCSQISLRVMGDRVPCVYRSSDNDSRRKADDRGTRPDAHVARDDA